MNPPMTEVRRFILNGHIIRVFKNAEGTDVMAIPNEAHEDGSVFFLKDWSNIVALKGEL